MLKPYATTYTTMEETRISGICIPISKAFFKYLLSACWRKIYRRFSSWQGLSLIRKFQDRVDLLKGHLSLIGTSASPNDNFARGPGDRSLIQFLHLNNYVFGMLRQVLPDNLQSVFEKLCKEVDHATKDALTPLYTKETALGFHYLVFGAFLLAGQAIMTIKDGHRPLACLKAEQKKEYGSRVEHFRNCIAAAVLPMKLLQCVLSSTAFKHHIGVWTSNGESVGELFPIWSQKSLDMKFGKEQRIVSTFEQGPPKESPSKESSSKESPSKESPSKESSSKESPSKESPSKESPTNDDDDDDCDDSLPQVCKFIC